MTRSVQGVPADGRAGSTTYLRNCSVPWLKGTDSGILAGAEREVASGDRYRAAARWNDPHGRRADPLASVAARNNSEVC